MKPDSLLWMVVYGLITLASILCVFLVLLWQHFIVELEFTVGLRSIALVAPVSILGMFWAAIIAHELGHLFVGLAVGMRVFLVGHWPLAFVREGRWFRLRLRWRASSLGYLIAYPKHGRHLRRRMFLYIAAGPLTNLLAAALLFLIATHWNVPSLDPVPVGEFHSSKIPWMPQSQAVGWVVIAAIVNLMLGLQSLIPGKVGELPTVGGQLASLLRGGTSDYRSMCLSLLVVFSQHGVRPRDWDRFLLEQALASRDGSMNDVTAAFMAYGHAIDSGLIDMAGRLLDQAIIDVELYPAEFRQAVLLEAIFFDAFYRGNGPSAREALHLAKGGVVEEQARMRAEAAVLFAEGRYEEAIAKAQAGLHLLPLSLDPGGALAEADLLNAICLECERRSKQAESPDIAVHSEGTGHG